MIIVMQRKGERIDSFNDVMTLGSIGSILSSENVNENERIVHWDEINENTTFEEGENIWICGHGKEGKITLGENHTFTGRVAPSALQVIKSVGAAQQISVTTRTGNRTIEIPTIQDIFNKIETTQLQKIQNICVRTCKSAASGRRNLSCTNAIQEVLETKIAEQNNRPNVIGANGISICDPRVQDPNALQKFSVINSHYTRYIEQDRVASTDCYNGEMEEIQDIKDILRNELDLQIYPAQPHGNNIRAKALSIYRDPRYKIFLKRFTQLCADDRNFGEETNLVRPTVIQNNSLYR